MKFVLFSDLHLEAPFGWDGPSLVNERRSALRQVLGNILDLADEVEADAVFCGGDLFEHTVANHGTGEFLRSAFESIAPVPVYISPGNHDWYGSESLYLRTSWSPNVHIFRDSSLRPVELESGLTLWGAAHRGPFRAAGFLDALHIDREGTHIALFHGSEEKGMSHEEWGDTNAPFSADQIPAGGLHHAFVGHYHEHHDGEHHTYSGNPDPLTIAEGLEVGSLNRGAVVVDVLPSGALERQRRRVAVTQVHDITLDVSSVLSEDELYALIEVSLDGLSGIARVTFDGLAACDAGFDNLTDVSTSLDVVHVRAGIQL